MKLSRIFQSKASAFKEAIATDDQARMRELFRKKGSFEMLLNFFHPEYFRDMTPAMAEIFVKEVDEAVMKKWNLPEEKTSLLQNVLLTHAITNERLDLVDVFMQAKIDYNTGSGESGQIRQLLTSGFSEAEKLPRLRTMFAGGYDKVEKSHLLLQAAVEQNMPTVVDFLVEIGFDIHANNEQYLRAAAKAGLHDMARHLVETHKADAALAARIARSLGATSEWIILDELVPVASAAAKPATIESLSAEVADLKKTVRELTALVKDLHTPKTLDKPVLKGPAA